MLYGNYPDLETDLCQAALGNKKNNRGGGGGEAKGKKKKGDVARDKISAGLRSLSPVNGGTDKENISPELEEEEEKETGMRRKNVVAGRHGKAAEMFGDLVSLMRERMDHEKSKSTGRKNGGGASTRDASSSELEKEKLDLLRALKEAVGRHEIREEEKHQRVMALLDKLLVGGVAQEEGGKKTKRK